MRENSQNKEKPSHIVSAWSKEDGVCLGQKAVEEKTNEITAIPELLDKLRIKGQIITIDAMGTQKGIAEKIRAKRADYVLALKGNQGTLYEEVKEYFADKELCKEIERTGNYKRTKEKAHSQKEIKEYYQTEDTGWMEQGKDWKGLKSIAMEKKSIEKDGVKKTEYRYYISSLKGDANTTIDKMAAQNQNIIRKWCLSILKMEELSIRNKSFVISLQPIKFLEEVLDA